MWRGARLGVEAYNRRDLDAVVINYHPELEYYPYREFVEAGLAEPCYHGPSGYKPTSRPPMRSGAPTSASSRPS